MMKTNWSNVLKKRNSYRLSTECSQGYQSGFTLIEIMIALLIVSVGVVGVMTATAQNIEVSAELERRTVASWVVSNRMAEVRYSAKTDNVSAGNDSETVKMGGYEWRVRTSIEETELDRVFLLTVEAHDQNQREDQAVMTMTSSLPDTQ